MFEVREKPQMVQRALLISIFEAKDDQVEAALLLEELEELVSTLGIGVVGSFLIKTRARHKRFICGTGKAEEIAELARAHEADCVVFDNQLAPSQQRAWEAVTDITVIDREEVILDIFAQRAQTREASLQVDLARMQYALPRMAKMWGHLDREGGGGGGSGAASRGMGEQQIEIDRRLARQRISRLKGELELVRKQRATQRKERERYSIPHAAIVGYTNAGKSSLLNLLSGSEIMAKDMLFATLDTTTRRVELPDGQPLLLTDTVGFVRNLPHRLVEAFKATLEEAVIADFLIHVLDAASDQVDQFKATTEKVLEELGAGDKPMILVFNKIDLIDPERLKGLKLAHPHACFISVREDEGVQSLVDACATQLRGRIRRLSFKLPHSRGDLVNLLHQEGKVLSTDYEEDGTLILAAVPASIAGMLSDFVADEDA